MTGQFQPNDGGESLLAYLAARFVSQRENLATEALSHILSRSKVARSAAIRSFRALGADVPDDLTFRTQATADDQAIPDLVGEDDQSRQCLLVEAKFWAGLTSAQPIKYLERLKIHGGGTLVFLVPALRADPVWQELRRRCQEVGLDFQAREAPDGCRYAELPSISSSLGLISWRRLLTDILTAVEQAGERSIASDVRQLQSLCDREDSEAFLPLESEELTSGSIPRRLIQFCALVDDLISRLVGTGIGDTSGLRSTIGRDSYGRYVRLHGIPCLIVFSVQLWASKYPTPIWLRVIGPDWKPDANALNRLAKTASSAGLESFQTWEGAHFPLVLPTGVERDEVLSQAEAQIAAIAGKLEAVFPVSSGSSAPALITDPVVGDDSVLPA